MEQIVGYWAGADEVQSLDMSWCEACAPSVTGHELHGLVNEDALLHDLRCDSCGQTLGSLASGPATAQTG